MEMTSIDSWGTRAPRMSQNSSTQMKLSAQSLDSERVRKSISNSEKKRCDRPSIESDALVAKRKLIVCWKTVENSGSGEIKATHVHTPRRTAWLVVSCGVYGRTDRARDSLPTVMGGNVKHYLTRPEMLRRVCPLNCLTDRGVQCANAGEQCTASLGQEEISS